MEKEQKLNFMISGSWLMEKWGTSSPIGKELKKIVTSKLQMGGINKIQANFKIWQESFRNLYLQDEVNQELFVKHVQLITSVFFIIYIFQERNPNKKNADQISTVQNKFHSMEKLLKIPSYMRWIIENQDIINIFFAEYERLESFKTVSFKKEDLFTQIYQELIANTTRHPQGEFYTHSELARLMVGDIYEFGDRVLDPSCGSGTFLCEIAKKIFTSKKTMVEKREAYNNLHGIDINPLACFMARANLILIQEEQMNQLIDPKIIHDNFLFPSNPTNHVSQVKMDLLIGNPPWVVLNRIASKEEKTRIKKLGMDYGILLGGKLATSTELTTIFITHSQRQNLEEGGKMFFVTPASLANAGQHALFRQFTGLKNIEFWAFTKDVFRIHNHCMKAEKGKMSLEDRLKIKWNIFDCVENPFSVKLASTQWYFPMSITNKDSKIEKSPHNPIKTDCSFLVGRLAPFDSTTQKKMISAIVNGNSKNGEQESSYKSKFRQGASLVPRNLLFIEPISNEKDRVQKIITIQPSRWIQSKKYSTWQFKAFERAQIESKYCFSVAKSTGLIPFQYIQKYHAFLPLNKESDQSYTVNSPKTPFAKKHYQLLTKLYQEHKKDGAQISNLLQRLNYGKALSDPRQFMQPKVVYNGIGSIVKAAIITDPAIIDTSLYFFIPETLPEAYFLLGILNSPYITRRVKKVGSTGASGSLRNIHKHPLDVNIPEYCSKDLNHLDLSSFAKELEEFILKFIATLCKQDQSLIDKPKTIQNRLFKSTAYLSFLNQLDHKVEKILKNRASM
ncbi:hypothetical protein WKT22_04525 [Candidatus Lokiarchaeum ossiferum]